MVLPARGVAIVGILVVSVGEDRLDAIEGSILRQGPIGVADTDIEVVIDLYDLADRVFLAEEGGGQGLIDKHGGWVLYCVASAIDHPEAKHPGKIGLRHEAFPADC